MINISSLDHAQFVSAVQNGGASVSIHRPLAMKVMRTRLMPEDYRLAYRLWRWVWLSLVPVAVAAGHLYSWWWLPSMLAALGLAQYISANRTAAMFVVEHARESELFYDIMVQIGILAVHDNRSSPRPLPATQPGCR